MHPGRDIVDVGDLEEVGTWTWSEGRGGRGGSGDVRHVRDVRDVGSLAVQICGA